MVNRKSQYAHTSHRNKTARPSEQNQKILFIFMTNRRTTPPQDYKKGNSKSPPETVTDTNNSANRNCYNSANRNRYNSKNRNRAYVWKLQTAFESAFEDGQNRKPQTTFETALKRAPNRTLHPFKNGRSYHETEVVNHYK